MAKAKTALTMFAVVMVMIITALVSLNAVGAVAETSLKYNIIGKTATSIVAPPTVVKEIKTKSDLTGIKTDKVQIGIFTANEAGAIKLDDETLEIESVVSATKGNAIIAFRVDTAKTAKALTDKLNAMTADKKINDLFFVSSDVTALKTARSGYPLARGVLDYTGKDFSKPFEVSGSALSATASIAIIDGDKASAKNSEWFRDSYMTVWSKLTSFDTFNAMKLVSTGVNGIVTDNPLALNECLGKINDISTLVRNPSVVGHRGASLDDIWTPETSMGLPENSMAAFKFAYENSADLIELDIMFSSDKQLMVIHDTTLNRTMKVPATEKLVVGNMTKNQIQQYQYLNCNKEFESERIPTLTDVLKEFKGKDIKILIEIKEDQQGLARAACEAVKAESMESQAVFLSFYSNQLSEARELLPQVPASFLTFAQMDSSGSDENVSACLEKINTYQNGGLFGYSPNTGLFNSRLFDQQAIRGINFNGWTYNNPSVRDEHMAYGVQSLTLDVPQWFNEMTARVTTEKSEYTAKIDEKVNLGAKTITYKGVESDLNSTKLMPILISGDSVKISNNNIKAVKNGVSIVVPRYRYFRYTIMGAPVKITVGSEDGGQSGGCSSAVSLLPSALCLVALGFIVTIITVKKSKKYGKK